MIARGSVLVVLGFLLGYLAAERGLTQAASWGDVLLGLVIVALWMPAARIDGRRRVRP